MAFRETSKQYGHYGYDYNEGDRERELERAADALKQGIAVKVMSTGGEELYRSQGYTKSPRVMAVKIDKDHWRHNPNFAGMLDDAFKEFLWPSKEAAAKGSEKVAPEEPWRSPNADILGEADEDEPRSRPGL